MVIKNKQIMYKVRSIDGTWAKKTGDIFKVKWVEDEHAATFWKKLHHLKASLKDGIFSKAENLDGAPLATFQVYEYEVTVERTGKKGRLSELDRFYEKTKKEEKIEHNPECIGAHCVTCGACERPGDGSCICYAR